jgi:hypothetical protein
MFLTRLKISMAAVLCAGLLLTAIGGSLAALGTDQNAEPRAGRFAPHSGQVEEQAVVPLLNERVAAEPAAVDTEAPTVELGDPKKYFKVIDVGEESGTLGQYVTLRLETIQPVDAGQFNNKYKVALFDKDNTLTTVQTAIFPFIRLEEGERIKINCWSGVRLKQHEWRKVVIRGI